MTKRHADSDDDTYVTVGRPFEHLETAEDVQKAKTRKEKEQYVTDSEGRRRFHGAFTGGFSAGYYNTVGSKEGWVPSTFISTRDKRTSFGGQRPEEFMDEEDFGAHGIAPKVVSARDKFDQSKEEEDMPRKRSKPDSNVIPGAPPLENLIIPSKSTIGARLLKAMGWKEGEGVGPKVVKYPAQIDSKKVYGPSQQQDDAELIKGAPSKQAEGFLFAPRDATPWDFEGKDDNRGLGYRGIEQQHGVLHSNKQTRSLYGISGEAFGTGALDDEDEDEDNVYGVESMTSYDITLAGEGELSMERRFGWTGSASHSTWDLSSFTKALNPPANKKSYRPPDVPRSFVPVHKFNSTNTAVSAYGDRSTVRTLGPGDRSKLLLETKGSSVFELLSKTDQDRLKQVSERAKPHSQAADTHQRGKTMAEPVGSVTEWEKEREKDKLAQVATIFKPLGTALASRFTRSQESSEARKSPESDAIQAARAKLFGVLTRDIQDWHPHRVLCKRFNVPFPYPGNSFVGVAGSKSNEKNEKFLNMEIRGSVKQTQEKISELPNLTSSISQPSWQKPIEKEPSVPSTELLPSNQIDSGTNEEVPPKPLMDIFKSIFADTSSDSESSSEESEHDADIDQLQSTQSDSRIHSIHMPPSQKRWQDLSTVTSHTEPIATIQSEKVNPSNKTASNSSNPVDSKENQEARHERKLTPDQKSNECLREPIESMQIESYGPPLPPGISSQDQDDNESERRTRTGKSKHHHKKSHRKHSIHDVKKEEDKKRKHKHSTHKKDKH